MFQLFPLQHLNQMEDFRNNPQLHFQENCNTPSPFDEHSEKKQDVTTGKTPK
jgi:hypothetical protein